VFHGRVDSLLGVSRALGDHHYKSRKDLPPEEQKVTALPDVTSTYLTSDDFLFLCCDGIMEPKTFANDGIGIFNFIHEKSQNTSDTAELLSDLIQQLLQSGSRDNMTAMIVEFKNGENFNSGREFLAGEYYEEFGNPSYFDAYNRNCEFHGKTVEEVRGLWDSRQKLISKKKKDRKLLED